MITTKILTTIEKKTLASILQLAKLEGFQAITDIEGADHEAMEEAVYTVSEKLGFVV